MDVPRCVSVFFRHNPDVHFVYVDARHEHVDVVRQHDDDEPWSRALVEYMSEVSDPVVPYTSEADYDSERYDAWGRTIEERYERLKAELWDDVKEMVCGILPEMAVLCRVRTRPTTNHSESTNNNNHHQKDGQSTTLSAHVGAGPDHQADQPKRNAHSRDDDV
jgi:hypothetical protein